MLDCDNNGGLHERQVAVSSQLVC